MCDSPPPGSASSALVNQHKGLTYERVLYTCPGYVLWGQKEKCPSILLAGFLSWVRECFTVVDSDPFEIIPLPGPVQGRLQGVQ